MIESHLVEISIEMVGTKVQLVKNNAVELSADMIVPSLENNVGDCRTASMQSVLILATLIIVLSTIMRLIKEFSYFFLLWLCWKLHRSILLQISMLTENTTIIPKCAVCGTI